MKKSRLGLVLLSSLALVTATVASLATPIARESVPSLAKATSGTEMTSFDAVSGDYDDNISFEATKGKSATAPVVNSGEIRVYQNGGLFTITAKNKVTISSVIIGSSMATKVTYSVDGGASSSNNSIAANQKLTITSLSCKDSIVFTCTGTDRNSRLYVNYLKVVYSSATLPSGFQDDLNDIDPYFSLAYKYTHDYTKEFDILVDTGKCPNDGSTALTDQTILSTTYTSKVDDVSLTFKGTTTLPDGVSVGETPSKVYFSGESGFKLGASSAVGSLKFSSLHSIDKISLEARAYSDTEKSFSVNGTESNAPSSTGYTKFEYDVDSAEEISITSTKRVYIRNIHVTFDDYSELVYKDVDFRLRIATDELETLASAYTGVSAYGVEVKTSTKTKTYKFDAETSKANEGQLQYVVVDLGDAIAHPQRFTEQFTIRAFATCSDINAFSTSTKTKSIVDLVKEYHDDAKTTDKVKGLYSYLCESGVIK